MNLLWYSTRATGEVALLFLTIVLTLGVLSALRVGGRRAPRFVLAGLHRTLTLAALGFLAVHIATTVADSYAPITVTDVVVPFGSAYRPIWLGLGTVAFDLLAVLTATSLLRTRLGFRRWKALHWAAYACWLAAFVHALGTGSDVRSSLFLMLAGVCAAAALAAVAWRLAAGGSGNAGLRAGAGLLTLVAVLAVGAWTVSGPLAGGWARRAGTPASLLGNAGTPDTKASTGTTGNTPAPRSTRATPPAGDRDDDGDGDEGGDEE
ncbi:ferric reductase-like transmembrane domain-containing protein [Actinoallomurus spadix]|uniref:Ferric oxidoreductase domain-containing protein n=1 Tax=Actinoallomurus spadix TaxID=79912 RepID=A0ABN0WZ43_9ACTN|nr:ferric reductase-like transmembrane domain-containing protein [Actinoallomurus spadix]MCO5989661.1 ferric reductase-like transmembrane domain-containing protein [Actinoallomurus spadix]